MKSKVIGVLGVVLAWTIPLSAAMAEQATAQLTVSVTVVGPPPEPQVAVVNTFMTTSGIVTANGTIPVVIMTIDY